MAQGHRAGTSAAARLPVLVKLAEALAVGDVAVFAGTDMDLVAGQAIPVASFARIPHDAVPAIRDAVRDPMLTARLGTPVAAAARRPSRRRVGAVACLVQSPHRCGPYLDARTAARLASDPERRVASALLADVYALIQHVIVWASEAELAWTVADRAMSAAQVADTPSALAGGAWTLGIAHRSVGDTDGPLSLATSAAALLAPHQDNGGVILG